MALEELDGLFNDVLEADRPAMRAILERNQNAAARLTQRESVYTAFVDGDTTRLATLTTPPAVVTPPAATSTGIDLDTLNRTLDERETRFRTSVETRAKELADQAIAAARGNIIGASAEIADQIYQIRSSHRTEFGEDLDRSKFDPFFTENAAKYGNNLTVAYNAFVSEKRTEKMKADAFAAGRAEGLTHQQTTNVPGSSLPSSPVASMFVKSNPMNTGAAATRGDALDAAAAAFRSLSASRVQ